MYFLSTTKSTCLCALHMLMSKLNFFTNSILFSTLFSFHKTLSNSHAGATKLTKAEDNLSTWRLVSGGGLIMTRPIWTVWRQRGWFEGEDCHALGLRGISAITSCCYNTMVLSQQPPAGRMHWKYQWAWHGRAKTSTAGATEEGVIMFCVSLQIRLKKKLFGIV